LNLVQRLAFLIIAQSCYAVPLCIELSLKVRFGHQIAMAGNVRIGIELDQALNSCEHPSVLPFFSKCTLGLSSRVRHDDVSVERSSRLEGTPSGRRWCVPEQSDTARA